MDKEIATITDIKEIPEEVTDQRVKEEKSANKFISGEELPSPPPPQKTWTDVGLGLGRVVGTGIGNVVGSMVSKTGKGNDTEPQGVTSDSGTGDGDDNDGDDDGDNDGDGDDNDGSTAPAAPATAVQICPATIGIRRLLNDNNRIERGDSKASYNTIMDTVLPRREANCTYPNILKDYVGLKRKFNEDFKTSFNKLTGQNIETVADEIDEMLVELYKREGTSGPLHELGNQEGFRVGGKKKGGSKKNKVEKKKERKTKRKYYIKKKKGNSKKNKKSKAKRNTRRK